MFHGSCFMSAAPRAFAAAALVVGTLSIPLAQEQPSSREQPAFRAGTTLVEVSAIVTRDGVPVSDLRADEVRVLDNGVAQPLVAFEYVDLTTVQGPAQRRDFVLIVDDLHISPELTTQTQQVADAFVAALGPHDRLGLVTTGPHPVVVDPTTDREAIGSAVERLRGQQSRGPAAPQELELRARASFGVLRDVTSNLQGDASERRTIVLVSEGHMLIAGGIGLQSDDPGVLTMYMDVVRDAALANVAIYAIDPRGLIAPSPGLSAGPSGAGAMMARVGGATSSSMATRRFGSLGTIAMHTGGTLTVDTNDLARDIPRIIRDSRQYYRMAYAQPEPERGKRQPKTRRIQVEVDRRGAEVRARQQYAPR